MKFSLESPYSPAGDQPQAIDRLVKGAQTGGFQTLLGVTGSGKSVAAQTPIYIRTNGAIRSLSIGSFVNAFLQKHKSKARWLGNTQVINTKSFDMDTWSFCPNTGATGWRRVTEISRHKSPRNLFKVTSACGRSVTVTGDHNFYVLRKGTLLLVKTNEIRRGDYIPVPLRIKGPTAHLNKIDISSILLNSNSHKYYAAPPSGIIRSPSVHSKLQYRQAYGVRKLSERLQLSLLLSMFDRKRF